MSPALVRRSRGQVVVVVPAAVEDLDDAHAALGQAPGQEAVVGEGARACVTSGP